MSAKQLTTKFLRSQDPKGATTSSYSTSSLGYLGGCRKRKFTEDAIEKATVTMPDDAKVGQVCEKIGLNKCCQQLGICPKESHTPLQLRDKFQKAQKKRT